MMIGAAFIVVALIGFFVGMAHEDRVSPIIFAIIQLSVTRFL